MKDQVALYAGTFDPITLGHLNIIQRAAGLFSKVIVGLAENSAKQTMFSLPQRLEMCRLACQDQSNLEVCAFSGLVVDFAADHKVDFLIRGIRNGSDLDFEMQMAQSNRLMCGIETIFIPTELRFSHINATLVREIIKSGHSLSHFVPPTIEKFISTERRVRI